MKVKTTATMTMTNDEVEDYSGNNDDKNGSMVSKDKNAFDKMKMVAMLIVKRIDIQLLKMRAQVMRCRRYRCYQSRQRYNEADIKTSKIGEAEETAEENVKEEEEPDTHTTKEGTKEKKVVEEKEPESNEAEKEIVERKDLDVAAVEE